MWNKKSVYLSNRPNEDFIYIYNPKTRVKEMISLSLYLNSFNEYNVFNEELKNKIDSSNKLVIKNLQEEITKNININNITNEEDDKEKQMKKLAQYIAEYNKEKNEGVK